MAGGTRRLSAALNQITLALGGSAGSRLAEQLGVSDKWLDPVARSTEEVQRIIIKASTSNRYR